MGVVPPKKGFLEGLRKLCDEYGALLIFDEVITGFRLAFGGAAEYFGVTLIWLPMVRSSAQVCRLVHMVDAEKSWNWFLLLEKVYQAGTLSGNPIAMAAGLTQLKYLYEHQEIYKDLEEKGKRLYGGMEKILQRKICLTISITYPPWEACSLQSRRLWIIHQPNLQIQKLSLNISRECLRRESIWLRHSLRQCFICCPYR